jgi:predicted DNA-binding transcriptional regulator AlpA
MSIIDKLPSDLAHHRMVPTVEAASFWGVSVSHWRRLYRAKKVPGPVKIADRKLAWSLGSLIDGLAARAKGDA